MSHFIQGSEAAPFVPWLEYPQKELQANFDVMNATLDRCNHFVAPPALPLPPALHSISIEKFGAPTNA